MFERTIHDERASELLKFATEKKAAKAWDEAIQALRDAYREIAQSRLIYPIETFIRLPQFLQLAGQSKEAWVEFNKLLFKGVPNELENDSVLPMSRSILFDKMRLFLQREKKEKLAEIFSIFSTLSWRVGLQRQGRFAELGDLSSDDDDLSEIISTLSEYPSPGTIKQLCEAIVKELQARPKVDYNRLGLAVEEIIASVKLA